MILEPDFCDKASVELEDAVIDQIVYDSDRLCARQYAWADFMRSKYIDFNPCEQIKDIPDVDFFRTLVGDNELNMVEIKKFKKSNGSEVEVLFKSDNLYNTEKKDTIIHSMLNRSYDSTFNMLEQNKILDGKHLFQKNSLIDFGPVILEKFFGNDIINIVNHTAINRKNRFSYLCAEQRSKIIALLSDAFLGSYLTCCRTNIYFNR